MKKPTSKKKNALLVAAVISGLAFAQPVDAANLGAFVASDYSQSQLGTIQGSYIDSADISAVAGTLIDLNRDPAIYNTVDQTTGKSEMYIRQYNYSTTNLVPSYAFNGQGDFSEAVSGLPEGACNAHGVARSNNFIYVASYDEGTIGVSQVSDTAITPQANMTIDLKQDLIDLEGISFDDTCQLHGEAVMIDGSNLYVIANVNPGGDAWAADAAYDPSYLMQYTIQEDGSLEYNSAVTMGKNTDSVRLNKYNNMIITSAIGGYQNYGDDVANEETSLDIAFLDDNGTLTSSKKVTVPEGVGREMRSIKVLPNGTAYIMCYNIANYGSSINLDVYKTTVSNLVSDTPNDWEKVYAKEGADGWFGRIDAEYDTNRLWMQVGNELNIFTDGETDPTVFGADDFTTNPAYNQLYTWDTIKTDQVAGDLAKLRDGSELVNNTAHLWKEIDSKTSTAPLTGGMGKNLYVTDIQYADLDNNILAAIRPEKGTALTNGSANANVQVENDTATPVGIYVAPDINVEVRTTKGLNIITKSPENGNSLTNAVWLDPSANGGSSLTIQAGSKLSTEDINIRVDGGMGGNGIAIAKTDRWGEDSKEAAAASTIHVEYGNVNIKGETNQDWGIGLRKDNVISRYNNTGIITKVEKGNILVDGNVDIDVYGNGIATVADDSSITVAKGGQITVPKGTDYGYYALASYGGDVAMNLGADGKTVGANDVNIDGDIFVLKKEDAADASVSLALTTENSHLSGIIDNGSTANLYLQNGAVWTNEANNTRYYQDNEDIGNGEKSRVTNFYGGSGENSAGIINQTAKSKDLTIDNYSGHTMITYTHDAKTPTTILGGDTTISKAAEDSSITLRTDNNGIDVSMKDTVEAVLDALAHKLYYSSYVSGERNLDGYVQIAEGLTTASVTQAVGDIEFSTTNGQGSLKADSTGGSGSEGEGGNTGGSGSEGEGGNTGGSGSEGEGGNTGGSGSEGEGGNEGGGSEGEGGNTGSGSEGEGGEGTEPTPPTPTIPDSQDKDTFTTPVFGDETKDTEYVNAGVLKDGVYEFTKDKTTINVKDNMIAGGPWLMGGTVGSAISASDEGNKTIIDLNGNDLEVSGSATGNSSAITAIKKGIVEINNPGDIIATATGTSQTAAIFTNGSGEIHIHNGEGGTVTVRADAASVANGAVIKTMNGKKGESKIIIDGMVDVVADAENGANEAISAVASRIEIGGGNIEAKNGAWAAIRAYGEFVTQNSGIVNVNVTKDADGNITGAGDRKTTIKGDFVTNGGMGSKGQISVGLKGKDSFWEGNYADNVGYGVTPGQLGSVNLWVEDGAHWKGFANGAVNLNLSGKDSYWYGFNTSEKMMLTLKDGAVWQNAITAEQTNGKGTIVDSRVGTFVGDGGFIDMTGAKVFTAIGNSLNGSSTSSANSAITESENGVTGNLVIDNYSGDTTVLYRHEVTAPVMTLADDDTTNTETTPQVNIIGGDITIKSAAEDSAITLRTDSDGIDLQDREMVEGTLDKLANKLYYTGYVDGERNLTGSVEIAEGLTTSSVKKAYGNIGYSETDGQGSLDGQAEGLIPDSQTKDTFTTEIFGEAEYDKEYLEAGVIDKDGNYVFTKDTTITTTAPHWSGFGKKFYGTITNYDCDNYNGNGIGNTYINMNGHDLTINTTVDQKGTWPQTYGGAIYAVKQGDLIIDNPGAININSNVSYYYGFGIKAGSSAKGQLARVIINNDNDPAHAVKIRGGMTSGSNFAMNYWGIFTNNDNQVHIKGLADIETNGAVNAWARSGIIDIGGGKFVANNWAALWATEGGTVNINTAKDENGKVIGGGTNDVVLKGDIQGTTPWYGGGGNFNVAFTTDDSSFEGAATKGSNINIWLQNGAHWNNTGASVLTNFYGDNTKLRNTAADSYIFQDGDDASLSIDNYSGSTTVIYKHDAQTPTTILGGDTTIKSAAEDSEITLRTDSDGIDLQDQDTVNGTLDALAHKLFYTNYVDGERNLTGYVQIAEGLTTASAAKKVGDIAYSDTDGQGSLVVDSVEDVGGNTGGNEGGNEGGNTGGVSGSTTIYGDSETAMMRGAKSAMASAAMIWRTENDDMMQRMGDIRLDNDATGIWAKYYGGKSEMDAQKAKFTNEYTAYQFGYDKKVDGGWTVGAAFSYNDGESAYELGGNGDVSVASLSLYGTRMSDDGRYLDLVFKGSRLDSDYTVYNDMRHKLDGDYDTWGASFSAEYGKRFEKSNGFYFDPSVQLTVGHIHGTDYAATSDFLGANGKYKNMYVDQDSMNSVIGRIGFGIGQKTEKANYFAKVALAHEFGGDFSTTYRADGEAGGRTNIDFGGTWCELQVGGSMKLSNTSVLYATYERSFGGDVEQKYRIDAGMRFSF